MRPEYDFSKGERGKLFRPDADVQSYLMARAAAKGVSLDELVNALLKQEIQLIESVK